jgi:hypothetical protein
LATYLNEQLQGRLLSSCQISQAFPGAPNAALQLRPSDFDVTLKSVTASVAITGKGNRQYISAWAHPAHG